MQSPQARPKGTRAEVATAIAGVAALAVASVALAVGWQTLKEQQKINTSLQYPIEDDVPPCHILTFKIVALTNDAAEFARGQHSLGDRDRIRLYFNDTQGLWMRDLAGVQRAEKPNLHDQTPTSIEKAEGADSEVEDCGEGG
ncbi:hypothetical protein ACIBXA_31715 [Micromonospora echinaurantiaca]|uniref:hypothetical protein n=1 Tax=Micromonospora echinaurantiaca TaxID=47857 RepID=UPI0037B285E8